MNAIEFSVHRVNEKTEPLFRTSLEVLIKGSSIDESIVNTLRRVILAEIPVYAISKSSIKIEENTTIFDNDEMRQRLSMIPLPNINNSFYYLDPKYYPYVSGVYGLIAPDKEYPKDPTDDTDVKIYFNSVNEDNDIKSITTNDCKIYINNVEEKNIFNKNKPLLVIKLRKGEKFKCSMNAILGIAQLHNCWTAVSNCWFVKYDKHEYVLILKSLGQINEWTIVQRACKIVILKLEKIRKIIKAKYPKEIIGNSNMLVLQFEDENHTMGNLLTSALQKHKNVVFAGYKMDHLLIEEITIRVQTNGESSTLNVIDDAINYLIDLFTQINNKLDNAKKSKEVVKTPVKKETRESETESSSSIKSITETSKTSTKTSTKKSTKSTKKKGTKTL